MPNVIPMIKKVFSTADKNMILKATEACSVLHPVAPTFGLSDEGDEYCVIHEQIGGAVRCHIHIKCCGGYARDHMYLGYHTFEKLETLLLGGMPDMAQEIFKQKKEQTG
jgi:hypothetical protein